MDNEAKLTEHANKYTLLERLRGKAFIPGVHYAVQAEAWMKEAADELERLHGDRPMSARPEPVEAYLLCDLPVGTRYLLNMDDEVRVVTPETCRTGRPVLVVEWSQRTYDGIPADALDAVLRDHEVAVGIVTDPAAIIRAAIAAQEQPRPAPVLTDDVAARIGGAR